MISISLIGSYRASCNKALSDAGPSSSARVIAFTGYKPSGLAYGNALAVCLYVWSGASHTSGDWVPLKREWL